MCMPISIKSVHRKGSNYSKILNLFSKNLKVCKKALDSCMINVKAFKWTTVSGRLFSFTRCNILYSDGKLFVYILIGKSYNVIFPLWETFFQYYWKPYKHIWPFFKINSWGASFFTNCYKLLKFPTEHHEHF
jgi:hypothetical protein